MLDGMDRPNRLGLLDRQTNLAENPDIGQMINHLMTERQSKRHLDLKINVNQSLFAINNIDIHKCTVNKMVRDSCMIANK